MISMGVSKEKIIQLYLTISILGFALFFYVITPFRLLYYWKIPLLEDNMTTLMWILPLLAFFPLYQFFREGIPKNLVKLAFSLLILLYIGEIFAGAYIGILLIFEGFFVSLLLIYGMKVLFTFYKQSSESPTYRRAFVFSFLFAGFGVVFLYQNPIFYQIFFALAALVAFLVSFFTTVEVEITSKEEKKSDGWTKKSHLCLWLFIVTAIALVIYVLIGIARMHLLVYPVILPEFQIYLIACMIFLLVPAFFIDVSIYLAKRINGKILIGVGLIIMPLSYLLFALIPDLIVFYVVAVLAGFGLILFLHNLINLIFKVLQEHGKAFFFCLAISIYFGQLLMALLTLHGGTTIFLIGVITVVEFCALIGVALVILSGARFSFKKKVNVKLVLSQVFKVLLILLLIGAFVFAYSSSYFLNIAEENYQVANSHPLLKIENSNLDQMFNKVYDELEGNLMIIPDSGHIFAIPGGDFYRKPVLWDTAYIAQIWKYHNVSISEQILVNFINQIHPNGLIPNTYHPLGIVDAITQVPLLAWACRETYEFSDNINFLEAVYPKLKRYNQWWVTTRDFDGDGLYSWLHRDETGLDDCPRFDLFPIWQINALDLNCYLALQMTSLAKIAEYLNFTADSVYYTTQAGLLADRIRVKLWDNVTGFFYDTVGSEFIKLKTSSNLLPLFTGVATPQQAARLMTHLNNPAEFNVTYPIPSVARDEPSFSNVMWRGPTWINLNYLLIRGLINYNYSIEASKIAYKTLEMAEGVFNETGTFWEFYNSTTGRVDDVVGKTGWVPASHYVGWDGLLTNMFIEYLAGVSFNSSSISFNPIIPIEWNASKMNLQLNQIELNLTRLNNQINSSFHFLYPSFNNVTVIDLQTLNQTTYFSTDIQLNFTNFNRYRLLIQ